MSLSDGELGEIVGLVTEVRGDVKLLLSHVVGNGNPGLLRRVTELEKDTNKVRGVIALLILMGPVLGVLVSRLLS